METIFAFLLNASAGIVLFYLVYWLFLRNETYYNANRWFLITALATAVLLPLFPLQYSVIVETQNTTKPLQTITDTFTNIAIISGSEETATVFNWSQAVLIIYLTGAAIFLLRLLSQTFTLIHLMIKYRIKSLNGVRIVENEKYGLPFSFFNIVFINPKFHTQDELPEILAHEKVHIRENHWFDLLFIELLTVIFWFNPFIWFFERSIKQNHEYLADKGVLAQGHTLGKYQAILVNQLMGMQIIGITNNLNFALNTNRLKMMTKKKTPKIKWVRFTWAMPVLAMLLFAFAEPEYRYEEMKVTESNSKTEVIKGEKEFTINGKVVHKITGKPMTGASVIIKGTTIGTVVDRDGTFTLVDTNPKTNTSGAFESTVVVSFVGLETVVNTISASGSAIKNAKYTFVMQDAVVLIDMDVPPPPPAAPKTKKHSDIPPPPPAPEDNTDEPVFFVVEDMPKYPGGIYKMLSHVKVMQKDLAAEKKLKGKAKVAFTVDASGKVSDIKVVEKDNDGAAKGAYAIVKEMKDWTPGKQRGKAVPVKYLLPVEFK